MGLAILWLFIGFLVLVGAFMIHPLLGFIVLLVGVASIWSALSN